jgi:hypothetical protein
VQEPVSKKNASIFLAVMCAAAALFCWITGAIGARDGSTVMPALSRLGDNRTYDLATEPSAFWNTIYFWYGYAVILAGLSLFNWLRYLRLTKS